MSPPKTQVISSRSCRTLVLEIVSDDSQSAELHVANSLQFGPRDLRTSVSNIEVKDLTCTTGCTSRRPAKTVEEGSDSDSDCNNEFDVMEIMESADPLARESPDADECAIVIEVQNAMDDAIDRLVGTSTGFEWSSNFDTFRGVPEDFSGPVPGPINDYNTPYDAFRDIWTDDFIELVVTETNRYAKQVINQQTPSSTSRLYHWKDTDKDEILLFFALHILMGCAHLTSVRDYWKSGYTEMCKFRQLMSYNRFLLLSKFLYFVDNSNVSQDGPHYEGIVLSPKLAKIAPLVVHLNLRFSSLYNLHPHISIDESLSLFKGRLSRVQNIRSKVARSGIKTFELCESKSGYLYRFEIYTGKNREREGSGSTVPTIELASKSTQVVIDLLKGLEQRGHCVTMDYFYNSPDLARYLKVQGFDCLGTLRVNGRNVPQDIKNISQNIPNGSIIARHSGDLSCIAWKDTRLVTFISTCHKHETYIVKNSGVDLIKPVVVRDYNHIMNGVNVKNQKLSMYLLERKRCVKWYMKIFRRLLNISILNAHIMLLGSLKRRNKSRIEHRAFRERLANALVEKHHRASKAITPPIAVSTRLRRDILHSPVYLTRTTRASCDICRRKGKTKKSYLMCRQCQQGLCFENCWDEWHSSQRLPGKDSQRKRKLEE